MQEYAGAEPPGSICILAHREEWVNVQLVEEMRLAWPASDVKLVSLAVLPHCDLAVFPFEGTSLLFAPELDASLSCKWVVFYGLDRRSVWWLKMEDARALLKRVHFLNASSKILIATKLAPLLKRSLRLWKRFLAA